MTTRRPLFATLLRSIVILAAGWLLLSWLVVLVLRFVPPWTSAVMMERQVGAWVRSEQDFQLRHRWVPWSQVSPYVPLAMVAGEDQKFPFHHGFDFDSIQNAMDAADEGRRLRGASTISQQTAKNLFLWNGRSFVRKGLEAYFTVLIELTWPKQRILEVYMNIAELGNGVYGVGAASDVYFHTPPARLGPAQAARLAAVLPNPRRFRVDQPSAYVMGRANWIQGQMAQLGGPGYLRAEQAPANTRRRR
ncbi:MULTISPECIES: monofunctional biosynthetic peptidoglycan transglycosylase [Dyella]|uniref:Biosynthetic peptidoglycan transglycosylase n=2 Tax=Dyella TaxID=231454 RepID=A0A4R0YYH9_9GAMM|nr:MULTISPECIES: monofunctional biosynthetic peptidoglycan transglycosylase [Dyella]TBR40330.1 monofunctional biosynthetic peptidoglycan transglycosylase [Dyella terrae]TCI12088.1 monofunctional biosynthetic peptidoglycan transglycosylase [Dyella soli]